MAGKIRMGVCLKAQDNPFWSFDVRKGFENAANESGNVDAIIKIPSRISKINEQIAILNNFLKIRVDIIVLAPSDATALIPIIKKIAKTKTRLIIIDSKIDEKSAKKNNLDLVSITFDNYRGGFETGRLFSDILMSGDEVAIIEGYKKGTYTQRVDGFADAVKNKLSIINIVSGNFEENNAYSKTKILVKKYPSLKGIFCTSDNMALGSYTALQELNRTDIKVSGFDLTHSGKIAVQTGKLLSSVDVSPEKLGEYAIDLAKKMVSGKNQTSDFSYKTKLVTKENLTSLPKQAMQKRTYKIVEAKKDLSEFNYNSLKETTVCPIIIGSRMFDDLPSRLKRLDADKFIIITDDIVKEEYGNKLKKRLDEQQLTSDLFAFPAGEKNKTFSTLDMLASKVLDCGISKKSVVILLGGGVVGNTGGFLAAILMRGIRFVHIPTTIMHQLDASTGGKQAVNTRHGKNVLGTFYEPEFIYDDVNCISTLSDREYKSGIAEALKHGLCESKEILELVKNRKNYKQVLMNTLELKTRIIEEDPRELNKGFILIYGHTLGHAIEILSEGKMTHGEAISIGMVLASKISVKMGFAKKSLVDFHENLLKSFNLPIKIPAYVNKPEIMNRLLYDKKERKKQITFCLLEDIGQVKTINNSYSIPVPEKIIKEVVSNG